MYGPMESMRSRFCVCLPHREMSANKEGGVRSCEENGRVESRRPVGRGEQLAPRRGTVLIYKGGDRKDPANYRPITRLPTITNMVTLAIHKRMRRWLFGCFETSILENEQRRVRSSQECKEAVLENLASNMMMKEMVELFYDFQKACDNVNHYYLVKLLDVYGFPPGVQMLVIEMMTRWKIRLSYGSKRGRGDPPRERHPPGRHLLTPALCPYDQPTHQDSEEQSGRWSRNPLLYG